MVVRPENGEMRYQSMKRHKGNCILLSERSPFGKAKYSYHSNDIFRKRQTKEIIKRTVTARD